MITWSMQFAVGLLFFALGVLSIGIVRRARPATPLHGTSWRVTAVVFTTHGLNVCVQNLWGLAAMRAGAASETMRVYLLAAPAFNHGRTFLLLAFCLLMTALALRPASVVPRLALATGLALSAGLAAGALLGLMEGGLIGEVHYAAVAQWDAIELVLLLAMLFAALVRDTMDRLNWGVLATYGFMLSLNIMWFAAMSFIDNHAVWSPRPLHMHMYRLLLIAVMVALAAWRYRMARAGTRVDGLMGTARVPVTSHVGAGWMG